MSEENEVLNPNRKTILVADDEQDLREALFTMLSAEGYEVLLAKDGEEALEIALREHPDLVLLDLMMPNMGGQAVLDAFQADPWGQRAKVIVLTALSDMNTVSTTVEKGGYDYLVKSDWKLEDIAGKVKAKLEE